MTKHVWVRWESRVKWRPNGVAQRKYTTRWHLYEHPYTACGFLPPTEEDEREMVEAQPTGGVCVKCLGKAGQSPMPQPPTEQWPSCEAEAPDEIACDLMYLCEAAGITRDEFMRRCGGATNQASRKASDQLFQGVIIMLLRARGYSNREIASALREYSGRSIASSTVSITWKRFASMILKCVVDSGSFRANKSDPLPRGNTRTRI